MVHNGVVIWGTFTGIGTRDSELTPAVMMEGAKVRRCSESMIFVYFQSTDIHF